MSPPPARRRRESRRLAALLVGVLVFGSIALVVGGSPLLGGPSFSFPESDSKDPQSSGPETPSPADAGREPTLWPFSRDSIWNLPIGEDAAYVPAGIQRSTSAGMTTDVDVLILTPTAPITPVHYNDDAWNGGTRCAAEGGVLFEAPIPADFVIPGAHTGGPHGVTPNYATAILATDGMTLYQGQPSARCDPNGNVTMWWYQTAERLDGRGNSGAHGGSMLSSIGGTIRLGELVPGGTIRHTMKLNMDSVNFYGGLGGFRWPATTKDSCAPGCYTGSVPEIRMGSLLALKPDFDFNQLETEPARILARAFIDYGAYIADNAGWSVYGIDTEYSPSGDVIPEFQDVWGFSIEPSSKDVPWARDMDDIFLNLHVVDNWDDATWAMVSASNGTLGVGLGLPRVPWAPEFGEAPPVPDPDLIAPVTSAVFAGTAGSSGWYRSPVTVTLSATDEGSGVASIHVRIDQGSWTVYTSPVTIAAEGQHTVEYYAKDVAGNQGSVQSVTFGIDTTVPATTSALSGTVGGVGWYRSAVTVTLTGTDSGSGVDQIRVRTNGGAWAVYGAPITIAPDGSHTVEYYSTDFAGNTDPLGTSTFQIDTLAPMTTVALSGTLGSAAWYVSPVTVTLSATSRNGSAASVAYHLDASPWVAYSGPFVVNDGRHVLQYQATDSEGHVEPLQSVSIGVDYTPPTVIAAAAAVIPTHATLTWVGSDDVSGIARYEVSADGGPYQSVGLESSLNGPWTIGEHVVIVKTVDAAGNEGTTRISFRAEAPPAGLGPLPSPLSTRGATLYGIIAALVASAAAVWYIPRHRELQSRRSSKRRQARDPEESEPDSSESSDEMDEF